MATTASTVPHPPPRINGFDFEEDDLGAQSDDSGVTDQDDAQAVLQPSMSAAATHLTFWETDEEEKRAALRKRPTGDSNYFIPGELERSDELDEEDSESPSSGLSGDSTPEAAGTPRPSPPIPSVAVTQPSKGLNLGQLPDQKLTRNTSVGWPSPWTAGPRDLLVDTSPNDKTSSRTRPSSSFLEAAFGTDKKHPQGRLRRSGSAGQEALKRLRDAIPSPTNINFNMLPNFYGSFRSSPTRSDSALAEELRNAQKSGTSPYSQSWSIRRKHMPREDSHLANVQDAHPSNASRPVEEGASQRPALTIDPALAARRPDRVIRRVASDDSVLYHVLSPQSSLDDSQFNDVHAMVNLRFRAIKESLPSLPKVNPAWRSSINLSSFNNLPGFGSSSDVPAAKAPGAESTPRAPSPQPASARHISTDSPSMFSSQDPFESILEELTGDIVVLGGYRGSILRSAEAPHQQLWAPVKVGLNMRKVNLEVGLNDEDEENMPQKIRPSGMLKNMGPVDISRKFIRRLQMSENARTGKLRVWDYGYDWRLSPHRLSKGLCEFLARLPSNQPGVDPDSRGALVVAHSLGGLITRHAVNQRPELFSGVLFAGVPQRTINILGPLHNGDAVLFNEKLLTAAVNFSIRTSFVFLPEDGFCYVDKVTGERYDVDFYNPEDWARWKLSPCVSTPKTPATKPQSSSFSSFTNSLRARGNSIFDRKGPEGVEALDHTIAPQMNTQHTADGKSEAKESTEPGSEDRKRYMEYLGRILPRTKQFRAELAHDETHESKNLYPPMSVLYSKSVPTVYAAQVQGREGIKSTEVYDDLLFRAGDGVTLAKEAMLPEGYSVVRGGKVLSDRGHITLLGDLSAVGRALGALRRGRKKGIGLGEGRKRGGSDVKAMDGLGLENDQQGERTSIIPKSSIQL
ncbi:hypothetical protein CC79DRAFT_1338134 [Sarocladium strictum]